MAARSSAPSPPSRRPRSRRTFTRSSAGSSDKPLRTILHISDVHFGPPHLPRVSEGVLELIDRLRPGFVVVSGDLTQRAKPEQFRQARAFVDRIPVPSLVVPGNHDVPLYRVWARYFDPYGACRKYFRPGLEPVYRDSPLPSRPANTGFWWP